MTEWLHPGVVLMAGALVVPLFKGRWKQAYLFLLAALAVGLSFLSRPGVYGVLTFLGQELILGRVDRLSLLFSYVFSMMALIGVVYGLHVRDDGQHVASLLYAGSALGVTFAGDLLTLFVFWEIMAFSSVFLIWSQRSRVARRAGFRYLLVHVFGGLALLGGIVVHLASTGSAAFDSLMPFQSGLAFYLILVGFILNAAVPPLGAWLADAYPEATVTGAVFMTAFTTKTAVYALIRGFPGTELLVWLGAIMALYGVVYAVLENDARRLLAYHIISQVGYMVCGVGLGTALALNGASSHAFAHILYKGLLFMGAGAVMEVTGRRKLNEMGGLYRKMPVTLTLYMIGGFSISAVPLFSGFVSKSMVVSAAGEDHRALVLLMLTLASSGTFLHTGLKLPFYMFFGRDAGIEAREPPRNMLAAMGLAAFLCIFLGLFPRVLYTLLPYDATYHPYTAHHVTSTLGLLAFTALGFFLLLRQLDPEPRISLDTDWLYRKGAPLFLRFSERVVAFFDIKIVGEAYEVVMKRLVMGVARAVQRLDTTVVDGSVNGLGKGTVASSERLRLIQTGEAHHYALFMVLGLALLLLAGLAFL